MTARYGEAPTADGSGTTHASIGKGVRSNNERLSPGLFRIQYMVRKSERAAACPQLAAIRVPVCNPALPYSGISAVQLGDERQVRLATPARARDGWQGNGCRSLRSSEDHPHNGES